MTAPPNQAEPPPPFSRSALRALALDHLLESEDLRARIARALHDDLGQALTVLNLHLYWLASHGPDDGPLQDKLDEMRRIIALANRTLEALARDCRPAQPSATATTAELLACIAHGYRCEHGLECALVIPERLPGLADDDIVVLSRVLHRVLGALAPHAGGCALELRVTGENGRIMLRLHAREAGVREPGVAERWLAAARRAGEWIAMFGGSCAAGGCGELYIVLPLSAPGGPRDQRRDVTGAPAP